MKLEELLKLALSAMENPSANQAEEDIVKIIIALEEQFGDSQKVIAEELQKLAKQIERHGQADVAMEFKQRTTSAMLRMNMERRRGLRPQPLFAASVQTNVVISPLPVNAIAISESSNLSPQTQPDTTILVAKPKSSASSVLNGASVEYVCHASRNISDDVGLFCRDFKGKKIWSDTNSDACVIKFSQGPELLIVNELGFSCSIVLSIENLDQVLEDLEAKKYRTVESFATPKGKAMVLISESGSKFALIARR
ncbi:MAG: hypothetical protein IAF58_06115 [Leptolyngbya sp.]|nr:hypothetical protein [Candidatus Melainabacteria bacterium]